MRVLIVYTHPHEQSFNRAILQVCVQELEGRGFDVRVKDLYAEGFLPVLSAADFRALAGGCVPVDIKKEQDDVSWAQALLFIYPVWWFDRPALLKGWIDRVFLNGFAFHHDAQGVRGLLKHRWAAVLQTAGSPEQSYKDAHAEELIQRPMTDGTLRFCGIQDVRVLTLYGVADHSPQQRGQQLDAVRTFALALNESGSQKKEA